LARSPTETRPTLCKQRIEASTDTAVALLSNCRVHTSPSIPLFVLRTPHRNLVLLKTVDPRRGRLHSATIRVLRTSGEGGRVQCDREGMAKNLNMGHTCRACYGTGDGLLRLCRHHWKEGSRRGRYEAGTC
jgi:hypothetical protein